MDNAQKLAILPMWVIDRIKEEMCLNPAAWQAIIAAVEQAEVPQTLPCEVKLPPGTVIGKGAPVSTLMLAIAQRKKYPVHARGFAEQHQGGPVAWYTDDHLTDKSSTTWDSDVAKRWRTKGWPVGELFGRSDPAEVERLRAENEAFDAGMRNLACQLSAGGYNAESLTADELLEKVQWGITHLAEAQARLVDSLRAQLDDLRRMLRMAWGSDDISAEDCRRIDAALSASAEPSAPIAWHVGGNGYDRICFENPIDIPGQPCIQPIHDQRQLIDLLKRYDLRNEDAGDPVELDALTDLATWKRRAIEAESKLRTYDPQVVELGERAMQALLAEPKPSELVLTKCRLCDQLQADLTERDALIDQLRSGFVFETGPYQVEMTEKQWVAALYVFENYNMGDEQHFVFLEEQGRGVISEILIAIGVARAPDADEVVE